MEKIRSGQAYLYRDGGINSTIIEVHIKDNIKGYLLNSALNKTLKRYPYMASKLVEKNGDFYIEKDFMTMIIAKTDKFRSLGSIHTGYHLIDVTYTENKIRVAFHHALCDGRGVKPFVETLIYYYCSFRYDKKLDSTGVHLAGEPLLKGETEEPIGKFKYEFDEKNLPHVIKDGFHLPENMAKTENYYRHEININKEDFIKYAKAHNATPAILLSLLTSESIKKINPNADKPIICSMAADYRMELGFENTHKNCVGSIYLPYSEEIEKLPLLEQATLYRNIMKEQKNPDAVKAAMNNQIGLFEKLDQINSLKAKQQMMSFLNNISINTYVLSYLGQMQIGGSDQYVESMHLYSSGTKGLILNMISVGNCISVDIIQSFESNNFVETFINELDNIGINYKAIKSIKFDTMKDETFITAGKQPEKYYKKEYATV